MMYYIGSDSTDPYLNLALEQYVFDRLDHQHSYFMLWQNANSIIIGKHQNAVAEINVNFVKEHNITVARRLSGGGAVYHDLGNLNFTFITDIDEETGIDFDTFCRPVQRALASFGVIADISGRNDMTIEGKKFSGNSQYIKHKRVMHHGTIMYDSDLSVLTHALNVSDDKIESKGIRSIRSRVTNIRPYMQSDVSMSAFQAALKTYMFTEYNMTHFELSPKDVSEVQQLRDSFYCKWEWNFGKSPAYSIRKTRRVENCGNIEIFLDIGKNGIIRDITFYGDFFSKKDPNDLARMCISCQYDPNVIKKTLNSIVIQDYFSNLDLNTFLSVLFD